MHTPLTRRHSELMEVELPEFQAFNLEEMADVFMDMNRKGPFNSRTTYAKILSWKSVRGCAGRSSPRCSQPDAAAPCAQDMLRKPLLKDLPSSLSSIAKQANRNITGFMGDRSSGKDHEGHAEKLLDYALQADKLQLRDELYLQIMKQLTKNPKPCVHALGTHVGCTGSPSAALPRRESQAKGWQLLCLFAGTFSPSEPLVPYVQSFLQRRYDGSKECEEEPAFVPKYAKHTQKRLLMTFAQGNRQNTPHPMEVNAAMVRCPRLAKARSAANVARRRPCNP